MPRFLELPVRLHLLSRTEAVELGEHFAAAADGALTVEALPEHLRPAAARLALWQLPVAQTRH